MREHVKDNLLQMYGDYVDRIFTSDERDELFEPWEAANDFLERIFDEENKE